MRLAMELSHLRYFIAVAEELHFRRAAERLHMSQPPLSQQIRQLEEEIGAQLLTRSQRKVELTAAGAAFLVRAREILDAVEDAARQARRVQRGEVGRLAVGFVGSAMYSFVPELLRGVPRAGAGHRAAPARARHDRAAAPARRRPARRRLPPDPRALARPELRDRARRADRRRDAGRAPALAALDRAARATSTASRWSCSRPPARPACGRRWRPRSPNSEVRNGSCRKWPRCRP